MSTLAHSLLEEQIREFIAKNLLFSPDGFPHSDEASLLHEGVIDSLGVTELVDFVQKAYGLKVEQLEITPANFDSVAKLAAYVRRKRS